MPLLFLFFLVSGFCSLVYENVWLRLSMAAFGVTSALVAIVLSLFMAGLALGSFGAGRLVRRRSISARRALQGYALAELSIGLSGLLVPHELQLGRRLLEWGALSGSGLHTFASALWLGLVLLPWCTAMGATFPLAMAALERSGHAGARRSFSLLYLANVLGATAGCLLPALVLIETLGFSATLQLSAALNGLLALAALVASLLWPALRPGEAPQPSREAEETSTRTPSSDATGSAALAHPGVAVRATAPSRDAGDPGRASLWLLFTSGLVGMGLEVVWVRQYTPYLGTVVYAFALLLAVYLAATFIGSTLYRWRGGALGPAAWSEVALLALAALVATDPTFVDALPAALLKGGLIRVLVGVGPASAAMGLLTPMLVDRWSGGDPARAGLAYAVNVLGCILGPLVAGFLLLPLVSERTATLLLVLPLFAFGLALSRRWLLHAGLALAGALVFACTGSYLGTIPDAQVKRDHTATVVASGSGLAMRLLVNGYGMTSLTPITKMMAHLPLAIFGEPKSGLVICFGMGTTFRSMRSWGIPTTVVELVPSVPELFGHFHADAAQVLASPDAHVVIDDGRRFLARTTARYDVIAIDPPPPVEAAVSSLLYSKEFYALARARLSPRGILQQWLPVAEPSVTSAVLRALTESFPYVRMFGSGDEAGYHFLASDRPIAVPNALELAWRMPPAAQRDMLEWGPEKSALAQLRRVLSHEVAPRSFVNSTPPITDDHPYNEYFFLRRRGW